MSRVYLLRHAKAASAGVGMRDFDRPLVQTGREDAAQMGAEMAARGYQPSLVLCSTAKRARETWECAAEHLAVDAADVRYSDALYSADTAGYLRAVHEADDVPSVMIVGHNPTMEESACELAHGGEAEALATLRRGFGKSALAVLEFEGPLAEVRAGSGRLVDMFSPKTL